MTKIADFLRAGCEVSREWPERPPYAPQLGSAHGSAQLPASCVPAMRAGPKEWSGNTACRERARLRTAGRGRGRLTHTRRGRD